MIRLYPLYTKVAPCEVSILDASVLGEHPFGVLRTAGRFTMHGSDVCGVPGVSWVKFK